MSHGLSREDYRKKKELEEVRRCCAVLLPWAWLSPAAVARWRARCLQCCSPYVLRDYLLGVQARKAGELPPEQDEDGNLINPHIPEFMAKAPWYLNASEKSGLKHQKKFKDEHTRTYDGLHASFKRGQKGHRAKSFRKGACTNCGAMTHKASECVERPRKVGAWKTGRDIAADEVAPAELKLTYDGKRDRYNGYDPAMHRKTIERYAVAEAERKKAKQAARDAKYAAAAKAEEEAAAKQADGADDDGGSTPKAGEGAGDAALGGADGGDGAEGGARGGAGGGGAKAPGKRKRDAGDSDSDSSSDDSDADDDDAKVADTDQGVTQEIKRFTTKNKMTVRNLRIREDTAKYLLNLDVNSAYYDPKSRSMRENPLPNADPGSVSFAGDNFTRVSGDTVSMAKAQVYAWDAYNAGAETAHLQANPTATELSKKQFESKKDGLTKGKKDAVLEKYGGAEHLGGLPKELALGETEAYVEYSRDGRLKRGGDAQEDGKSRYAEDLLELNHTQIWGSYFDRETARWGYGCCHQTMRKGYCTGAAGKRAAAASQAAARAAAERPMLEKAEPGSKEEADIEAAKQTMEPASVRAGKAWGENLTPDIDPEKLKKELKKAKRRRKEATDERERKYNSVGADAYDVTEEEMEAYRMTRIRKDDPMAKFLENKDGDSD